MQLIHNEINKILYKVFKTQNPILGELIMNWTNIVGNKLSAHSVAMKVIYSKENKRKIKILYIAVNNSSTSMEMSYQHEIIIERIAIYLGYKAIDKIKLIIN